MGIESLFPDFVKVPIMVLVIALLMATQAARRYPHVGWLQKFHIPDKRTEAQKQRARTSANFVAGFQIIGFGFLIPPGYGILEVMFMSSISTMEMFIVGAASIICISVGVWVLLNARKLR